MPNLNLSNASSNAIIFRFLISDNLMTHHGIKNELQCVLQFSFTKLQSVLKLHYNT